MVLVFQRTGVVSAPVLSCYDLKHSHLKRVLITYNGCEVVSVH